MIRRLRILLLGGSGFLSGTLARVAVAAGHDVTVITRGRRPVTPGLTALVADRSDRAAFAASVESMPGMWDLVVDGIPYHAEDALQDVAVFSGRAARLVFVSTDFVYHPARRTNPQSEDAADDAYATAGYGGEKRRAELALMEHACADLPWTILRPAHIYGPGSHPGCLPLHGRDPELIAHLRAGRALKLVAGGRFLQQPVFAPDLARVILDVACRPKAVERVFNVAGPDVIPARVYYEILGDLLGCAVRIEDVPTADFLAVHPDKAPLCCERVYDLTALSAAGVALPSTPLAEGLRQLLVDLSVGQRG